MLCVSAIYSAHSVMILWPSVCALVVVWCSAVWRCDVRLRFAASGYVTCARARCAAHDVVQLLLLESRRVMAADIGCRCSEYMPAAGSRLPLPAAGCRLPAAGSSTSVGPVEHDSDDDDDDLYTVGVHRPERTDIYSEFKTQEPRRPRPRARRPGPSGRFAFS